MSQVKISGNPSGSGIFTISAPNSSTNRALVLPDNSGTILTTATAGTVLQVVSTTKTNVFSTSTAVFVDITGLSVSITPTSATSKILVQVVIAVGNAAGNSFFNLVRDSTNVAQSIGSTQNSTVMAGPSAAYNMQTFPVNFLDSPSTTSATTYKLQINTSNQLVYVNTRATDNYYGGISTITVMEIAA